MVEALSEGEIVYGINGMKNVRGASGLVALQVADQVPGSRQVFELLALPFPFLDAVFAEVAEAGLVGFPDGFVGMGFRDGDQSDFCGMRKILSRFSDAVLNAQDIFADGCWHGGELTARDYAYPSVIYATEKKRDPGSNNEPGAP